MPDHMELEDLVTSQIEQHNFGDVNRCVCCGTVIPEGRHVCISCEEEINKLIAEGGRRK